MHFRESDGRHLLLCAPGLGERRTSHKLLYEKLTECANSKIAAPSSAPPQSSNMFSSSTSQTQATSGLFGGASQPTQTAGGLFGGTSQPTSAGGLFGTS